jgi:hypothetical protein
MQEGFLYPESLVHKAVCPMSDPICKSSMNECHFEKFDLLNKGFLVDNFIWSLKSLSTIPS